MDVALLCLAILAVAAYVALPLYRSEPGPSPQAAPKASAEASRRALADLEVDRASGLVDEATYARERAALEARLGAGETRND